MDWQYDVPLLTNRHYLGALARALLGSGVLGAGLVSLGLAVQGEWQAIPVAAGLLLAASGGLFLVGLVVMAFPFRNRMRTRFTVDGDGVRLRIVDGAARASSRGSFLLGLVLGSGATAGAGMLAASREDQQLRWTGAFVAVPEPATRTIAFRNGWRTLLRVYCTPDGFAPVVAAVQAHMARHGTAERCAGRRSPLRGLLVRTGLVVVAMLPVFAARETFRYGLLAPWILMCFALATVWLVRPLAWVVLGMEGAVVAMAIAGAVATQRSYLGRPTYRRFEVFSGDDWAVAALALASLAFLAWLAVATLRRSVKPALEADDVDAGEGDASTGP